MPNSNPAQATGLSLTGYAGLPANLVKRNIVANYAGSFWMALMPLLFIPLYIRFMGVESFGLVGFFTSLQALFVVLDLGMRTTLTREIARLSAMDGREQESRDLVRTFETIFWLSAVVICLTVAVMSSPIANYWIRPEQLSVTAVRHAVLGMGGAMALRWPFDLYAGALMGLQKQGLLNVINSIMATVRGGGAVLVLWLVSPTIEAFFLWQIAASALETSIAGVFVRISLPKSPHSARFRKNLLVGVWRFAAGIAGINVMSIMLSQADKIVLSKMLTLDRFGYYMLAWAIASSLYRLVSPIYDAVFPRFSQMVVLGDTEALKDMYHTSCQLLAAILFPASAALAVFSYAVISIWTQEPVIAENAYSVTAVLAIGSAASGMTYVPTALQFAFGYTNLLIRIQAVCLAVLPVMLIWLVPEYGMLGGALSWTCVNIGCLTVMVFVLHSRMLKGERTYFYLFDLGLPSMVAIVTALAGKALMPSDASIPVALTVMAGTAGTGVTLAALISPHVRGHIFSFISLLPQSRMFRRGRTDDNSC